MSGTPHEGVPVFDVWCGTQLPYDSPFEQAVLRLHTSRVNPGAAGNLLENTDALGPPYFMDLAARI